MSDSISKDVLQYIGEDDIYSTDFENATIISINEAKIRRSLISKDVMQYMKENDLHFTDFEKATIIYNSELSVNEKHFKLKMLAEETDNVVLKKQIEDRLFDDRKLLKHLCLIPKGMFMILIEALIQKIFIKSSALIFGAIALPIQNLHMNMASCGV